MPQLYIIAGPNGVGKSTYVKRFLPDQVRCFEFVNADLIAQGISPFAPEKISLRAGRIMLERLAELRARGESFSFETTLSGRGYVMFLKECHAAGYRIHLDFLWVPTLALTKIRVAQRVRKGGHNIPADVQERRFFLGIRNLFHLYRPCVDHWRIYDNSGETPYCIAEEKDSQLIVHVEKHFDHIQQLL